MSQLTFPSLFVKIFIKFSLLNSRLIPNIVNTVKLLIIKNVPEGLLNTNSANLSCEDYHLMTKLIFNGWSLINS